MKPLPEDPDAGDLGWYSASLLSNFRLCAFFHFSVFSRFSAMSIHDFDSQSSKK